MRHHLPWTAAALASTLVISAAPWAAQPAPAPIAAGTLKRIASVDERFQSYNVEMAEVIGGNFWKPYSPQDRTATPPTPPTEGAPAAAPPRPAGVDPSMFQARPPIDLGNRRLRTLAAALGPAYMRTSGSWANTVYFHDADTPAPDAPPKGFRGVLTRAQWKGVVDFSQAVNAKLVSSFTISEGVRDASGVWTPDQARRLLALTKAAGGEMYAAEFFNEPDIPSFGGAPAGYTAADFARDFAVFRAFVKREAPALKIAGPGSVGEAVLLPATGRAETATGLLSTADMLTATPRPTFDILSYHFYGAVSRRCGGVGGGGGQTSADAALSEDWLALAEREYAFYRAVRDRLDRSLPIWVTETGESACGGNPWASTFLDTFRYLDQMARLARRGVAATFHNTLAASDYALLDDRNGFTPRPSYWAALLWHRLMGPTVLDAGVHPALHLYAQCLPGRPGGVTLLAINTNRTEPQSIDLSNAADRYTLSATPLESQIVQVNGRDVSLQGNDALPELAPARVAPGRLTLAPATITFLAIGDAGNAACGGT